MGPNYSSSFSGKVISRSLNLESRRTEMTVLQTAIGYSKPDIPKVHVPTLALNHMKSRDDRISRDSMVDAVSQEVTFSQGFQIGISRPAV